MRQHFVWPFVSLILVVLVSLISSSVAAGDIWSMKAEMPGRSYTPVAAAVEGKIYVFGGDRGGGNTLGNSYEYDPASNAWQTKADLPTPRMRHSACAINGKIYVIGGTPHNHGDDVLATVEEYDPATDTWTRKADMPTPRHSLTTSVVDGKIYAIGGAKGSAPFARAVPVRSVEVYEPATDTWEKRKDMPITPEVWEVPTATGVIGGKIYFPRLAATYEYDPATDTWELDRTGMPTPRISTGGAVVNDRFYVIAGYCCDFNASNKESVGLVVEAYDPLTDTWTTRAPMLERVAEFGIAVSEGKIYTFGGYNGEMVVSTVEEYTPEGWPFKVTSVSPQGKLSKSWGEIKTAGE